MTWSETCPTEPGWYWMRQRYGYHDGFYAGGPGDIVRVLFFHESRVYGEMLGAANIVQLADPLKVAVEWAGPIPIPAEVQ